MRCNEGLRCESEFCVLCGRDGNPCCMGLRCDQGFVCRADDAGSSCSACGSMGRACCADGLCGSGLACESGRCVPCGGATQICCTGGRCEGSMLVCRIGGPDDNRCF